MITLTALVLLGLSFWLLHIGRAFLAWTLPPLLGLALWIVDGIEATATATHQQKGQRWMRAWGEPGIHSPAAVGTTVRSACQTSLGRRARMRRALSATGITASASMGVRSRFSIRRLRWRTWVQRKVLPRSG